MILTDVIQHRCYSRHDPNIHKTETTDRNNFERSCLTNDTDTIIFKLL